MEWTFSDFNLLDELARSSTGAVYKARHIPTSRIVVLKERRCGELGRRSDIMHEINLLTSLHHPNVIECHGHFFGPNDRLYIILEYALYGDLFSHIAQRRKTFSDLTEPDEENLDQLVAPPPCELRLPAAAYFPASFIWQVFQQVSLFLFIVSLSPSLSTQIASGLAYIHSMRILHRCISFILHALFLYKANPVFFQVPATSNPSTFFSASHPAPIIARLASCHGWPKLAISESVSLICLAWSLFV